MKKILALLLVAVLALTLIACNKDKEDDISEIEAAGASADLVYNDFKYAVNEDGEYEITGYVFGGVELLDLEIPADIEGRAVTGIAADAFKGAKNLKSITLPNGLLYVGDYAFYDCDYITKIDLPSTVTAIGTGAFEGCEALASVTFPKALVTIGNFAFRGCTSLGNFTLSDGLISIGAGAFDGCASLTELTLPKTVIAVGDTAFYGCKKLETVTVNAEVTATDVAILEKMNEILAAYETEEEIKPATAADAFDVLEKAGIVVGGDAENGIKYVWDQKDNKIVGALSATDAELVAKLNNTLSHATEAPEDIYKLKELFTAAGLTLDNLNSVLESSKYHWNAETNRMELTYTVGACVFHATAEDLTVYTVPGCPMETYAEEFHTVKPIPTADEAE